ncbi:MAG TPA: hypothetical protein VEA78_06575 [Acidimicrobiales bacterium]|nr:hypothetical protein [Acidimicrobiales bacterium]
MRLTVEQAEALRILEFLDDLSAPERIRRLLDQEIALHRRSAHFKELERIRIERRAEKAGELRKLPSSEGHVS